MVNEWIFTLDLICSIIGIFFFALSLFTVKRIMELFPSPEIAKKWKFLFILILFFLTGYIGNIIMIIFYLIDLILLMVALVYFFGGFFVYLIIKQAYITYLQLDKAIKTQKDYIDQILKASQFKTDFLATMSHELRTPLNAIIGFTDLILEGIYGHLSDDQQQYLIDIKSSAEYQYEMVKNILDISKIESGKLSLDIEKFSLNTIVNQVKASFKSKMDKKGLKFYIKGLANEKKISADPIKFREIIKELVDNAVKFTKKGEISFSFQEDDSNWMFSIEDTGIGIKKRDFEIVFEDFKRSIDPYVLSTEGSGLGLSLTKRLINLYGGELRFESAYGKGSKFYFNIPKPILEKI